MFFKPKEVEAKGKGKIKVHQVFKTQEYDNFFKRRIMKAINVMKDIAENGSADIIKDKALH